jgi:hypothetical protein
MANTTNFNWETPDDTDLVKDGAAAIRTLGSAIDTSLVDLKGGTTGQVLSKATNTDMDFTWVAQDDSNAIQNALLTTTGDTIYASGASTPARLGIGTTGQVLTVAAGVPSWATPSAAGGGLDLISTTSFSAVASQSVNSCFSATYDNYLIKLNSTLVATSNGSLDFRLRVGGTDTTTNYRRQRITADNTTLATARNTGASSWEIIGYLQPAFSNEFSLHVANPFNTVVTTGISNTVLVGGGNIEFHNQALGLNDTTSYTGFTIICPTTMTGSVSVYGYKK